MAEPAAFHVGEYLADELDARGWTTRDCAERMSDDPEERKIWEMTLELTIATQFSPRHAAGAHMGKSTAEALERALGTSAQTWLNLDAAYHERMKHAN